VEQQDLAEVEQVEDQEQVDHQQQLTQVVEVEEHQVMVQKLEVPADRESLY